MLPELLYEIYKYISPEQYLKLNEITILKKLVDTFRDPLEAKYIYFNRRPVKGLNHGLKYIALTNPNYSWVKYDSEWCLIEYASWCGHLEIVKLLLEDERVDPSDFNNEAIIVASSNGHLEVVKLLLQDERVDLSDSNNWLIRWASCYGYLEVVKLLLQDEIVDPSDFNNEAIRWASRNGHLEIVKLLLEDPGVRQSLTDTKFKYFSKQINYKNDSYYR